MEFVLKIVFVLFIVFIALIVAGFIDLLRKTPHNMSFKESMDLCDLPVVTFIHNNKRLNFLLDTGSSKSVIDSNALKDLAYEETNKVGEVFGVDGNKRDIRFIKFSISYKNVDYEEEFQVLDMSAPFGNVKSDYGVTLHGILSSTFFQKYKYVLDFAELIAYSKR